MVDQLSTMEQRPHENPALVAKGHMQYSWCRPKMREQAGVRKEKTKLNAHMAVEDGEDFVHWLGKRWIQGKKFPAQQSRQ